MAILAQMLIVFRLQVICKIHRQETSPLCKELWGSVKFKTYNLKTCNILQPFSFLDPWNNVFHGNLLGKQMILHENIYLEKKTNLDIWKKRKIVLLQKFVASPYLSMIYQNSC